MYKSIGQEYATECQVVDSVITLQGVGNSEVNKIFHAVRSPSHICFDGPLGVHDSAFVSFGIQFCSYDRVESRGRT